MTEKTLSIMRKSYHTSTLSPKNSIWTALGLSPGFCSEKQATNRLLFDSRLRRRIPSSKRPGRRRDPTNKPII